MSKRITQVRFYGNGDLRNVPKDLTGPTLINGKAFSNYTPIVQLGIQALPITYSEDGSCYYPRFSINDSNPIQIGSTGIYELNLNGLGLIESLKFDYDFISQISTYNNQSEDGEAHILIDLVYEEG